VQASLHDLQASVLIRGAAIEPLAEAIANEELKPNNMCTLKGFPTSRLPTRCRRKPKRRGSASSR
jgi:hypothetical protein